MLAIRCYASTRCLRAPHHRTLRYLLKKTSPSSPIISATFSHPASSSSSSRRTLLVSIATTTLSTLILSLYASSPSKSAINTDFFDLPNSGGVKALDLRAGIGATPVEGDQVISGIEAAVRSMKVGGTRRVIIPPSQGYQNTSQEPIPPNFFDRQRLFTTIFNPTRLANGEGSTLGTLIFDIELISIRR
ncbi:hypothetical protein DITRI_Ditri02bG0061300 [Diplodiscus trichospermus]